MFGRWGFDVAGMDRAQKPGNSFFGYANGTWERVTPIPADRSSWGGFGVLRDPIACKPAVMAETDQYVAFGSEYRALVNLPGIETARVWEPEPATVYFWDHGQAA